MKKLWDNKFSIIAAAGIFLGLYMSKGGIATAMMPLLRVLLPIVVVLIVFSLVKKKVSATLGGGLQKKMKAAMEEMQKRQQQQAAGGASQQTIDLCNKCGEYQAPGHVCK